jgi:hypothetical protein
MLLNNDNNYLQVKNSDHSQYNNNKQHPNNKKQYLIQLLLRTLIMIWNPLLHTMKLHLMNGINLVTDFLQDIKGRNC